MTIEEQIKILCVHRHINISELARRLGQSPSNLHGKLKRQSLSVPDLEKIAEALDCRFERFFILPDGEKI